MSESPCPNCNRHGPHFVPPSLGEPGFFICDSKPAAPPPSPSTWAMGEAIQVVAAALSAHQNKTNLLLVLPLDFRAPLHEALALAIDAARKVPDGCVRQGTTDHKVLGTLPMTADGCVIGQKAYLWNTLPGAKGKDDDRPMRICYKLAPIMDPDVYTDGPMKMYSTREAAEAARKGTQ